VTENSESRYPRRVGWRPLTYSYESGNGLFEKELPLVIAVLADLSNDPVEPLARVRDRKLIVVDAENLDAAMANCKPRVAFQVPDRVNERQDAGDLTVDLHFTKLADFRPERIARMVPVLDELLNVREQLAPLAVRLEIRPTLADELRQMMADSRIASAIRKLESAEEGDAGSLEALLPVGIKAQLWRNADLPLLLRSLYGYLSGMQDTPGRDMGRLVDGLIQDLDARISRQLDDILHNSSLQRLEATWRGLDYLARETESGSLLKLRVLNVSLKELRKELKKAISFDESSLFTMLHVAEEGTFGGEPYGLVLCDYEIGHEPEDIALAQRVIQIGAAMSAPFVFGASPAMFGMDDWSELPRPRDVRKIFETPEHEDWRKLRADPDAAHLVLVLPRLLARLPWDTRESIEEHGFAYTENASARGCFLWMNGAFGMAALVSTAFARDRWCADLRGPIWGRIDRLPAHCVVENQEVTEVIGPTEVDVSEHRHFELGRLGFTSIARHRSGEYAAVQSPTTLGRPRDLNETDAANAYLALQLEHVLCVGRVKQVVRSFLKDHIGQWANTDRAAAAVEEWLRTYCLADTKADTDAEPPHGPVAPFQSVRVRAEDPTKGHGGPPRLELELDLNYVPKAASIRRVILLITPAGFISTRLIP